LIGFSSAIPIMSDDRIFFMDGKWQCSLSF